MRIGIKIVTIIGLSGIGVGGSHTSASADFCDGKAGFFGGEMTAIERLMGAQEAAIEEITELNKTAASINFDLTRHVDMLQAQIEQDVGQSEKASLDSCHATKSNEVNGVEIDGVVYRSRDELLAKSRMELASYVSNSQSLQYITSVKQTLSSISGDAKKKAVSLGVILRQIENLVNNPALANPGALTSVINNACVSLDDGEKIRSLYVQKSSSEIYAEFQENSKVSSIDENALQKFISACELPLVPTPQFEIRKECSLFEISCYF